MTQTLDKLSGDCTLSTRIQNISEITVSEHLSTDESEVEKIIKAFNLNGEIPEIIVTPNSELIKGAAVLEAAKRLNQQMVMVFVEEEKRQTARSLTLLPIELLYTHPLNASIYGENEDLTSLREAIAASGWVKPLLITPDGNGKYKVVSGNSCYKVCLEQGDTELLCEIKDFATVEEELKALLSSNVGREKTIEQKVREGLLWEQIERKEAQLRSRAGKVADPMKNSSGGTTRDIIAKRVGLGSGVNYEHAVAAVKEMDGSKNAPVGSVQHHRHEQFKQMLSKPRGVDAAYKLVKGSDPPTPKKKAGRWMPKEFEKVRIIGGEHRGGLATVRVITGLSAVCHVDGTPEEKRYQISLNQMERIEELKPATSVTQELKQKQKDLGLGRRSQILPSQPTNTGMQPTEQLQASATNLNLAGDALVTEVAIALLRLNPKQLHEVMLKVEPNLETSQLEAIWQALQPHFSHKAA